MAKRRLHIKTMWTLSKGWIAAIILLSSIFVLEVIEATSVEPLKTRFGWQYEYDAHGRIASITDPAKKKTRFRYTQYKKGGLSGMTQELPGGSRVKFKFDKYGRRTEMVDSAGTVHYVYDKFGRLTKVHREGSPVISYSYETIGRIKSVFIGLGFTLQYVYDFRGRPSKIITPVGNILFSYNSKTGTVVRRLPNGISTRWVQSPDGGLESITHISSGNRPLAKYQYAYRLDGLITSIKELTPSGVQTRRYHYDTAQRLVSASGTGWPKTDFAYDKLGNRTNLLRQDRNPISAQYDWADRILRYDGQVCQHDPAGNLTSRAGSPKSFTFGDTSLLKTANLHNGSIDYRYDGDGYLISRNNGTDRQTFVSDPLSDIWQPLVMKSSGGQQTFYIWDGVSPMMAITGNQVRYFLHDHLGSVRLVADRRGDILDRLDYAPFGQPERKPVGTDLQPGFAGLFFDKAAFVYLTRARAYDPKLGRFLQRDPAHRPSLGAQEDLSQYPYCANDPVNFVDRSGGRRQATGVGIMTPASLLQRWEREASLIRMRKMSAEMARKANKELGRFAEDTLRDTAYGVAHQVNFRAYEASQHRLADHFRSLARYPTPLIHNTRPSALADAGISTLSSAQGGFKAGARFLQYTGRALFGAFGETGLQHRTPRGYYGYERGKRDGVNYTRMGTLDVTRQGMQRLDYTKITGNLSGGSFTYQRGSSQTAKSLGPLGNIMQRAFPLRGYDPSDTIRTVTRYQSTQSTNFSGAAFNRAYADFEKTGVYHNPMEKNFSGFNESNVGGIHLTGAGNSLSHLGRLEGIALDKTNDRLVLISNDQTPIKLPPLRIDDVVTIFRSVYIHGEAPSVSIDPISDKKTEKWMKVRHGAATENTYVEWVLYEADRIMKNYSLGKNNKTKKKVYSRVPGYRDFNAIGLKSRIPQWERFWIVPASLTRIQGKTSELTIFDVPLKLETEKMEWDGTKLITARSPRPSRSAAAYTSWFTSQYDKIAKEVKIRPPKHCGFEKPVAVYEELRRIALITAIAETLRDQNVPFPGWMNDYPVKPCICDRQTPVLRVAGEGYEVTGGVQLATSDKDIRTRKGDSQVSQLAEITRYKTASKPLFAPVSFQQKGKTYKAVTLPGADTQRSGANILRHTDLTAPALQDAGIDLTRQFNSFHDPRGMFGHGWTLDLPRLEQHKKPTKRTGNSVSYQTVYQLTSPLNTWSERFAEIRSVREVNRQLLIPSKSETMLGVADVNNCDIGQKTKKLFFRDGGSWHFNTAGYLVARSDKRTMVIYQRDKRQNITSIRSWQLKGNRKARKNPDAQIRLHYDAQGKRIRSIDATSPKLDKPMKVHYFYNSKGQLVMVISSEGKLKYTYRDGLVASITDKNNNRVAFGYNKQGQLQAEKRADGKKVAYKRITTSVGTKVIALDTTTQNPIETVEYDANFSPLKRSFGDGSSIAWKRGKKSLETTVTQADGEYMAISESNDGRHSTLRTSAGEVVKIRYDDKRRVTRSELEGGPTIEQKWHTNGKLQAAITDDHGILPKYSRDGKLSSVMVAPPEQARTQQVSEFVKVGYDAKERIAKITDDSGSQLQIGYDKSDQPSLIRSNRGSVKIDRDAKGQVRKVGTSWGFTENYDYDKKTGNLSRITLQQQQAGTSAKQTNITLTDGHISKIQQADGGETSLDYYQSGKQKGLLKKVKTTENMALAYTYDTSSRLTAIDIGDTNAPAYRINYNYDSKGRLKEIFYTSASGR